MDISHADGSGPKHKEEWKFYIDFDNEKTSLSEGMLVEPFEFGVWYFRTGHSYPNKGKEWVKLPPQEKACVEDPSCSEYYDLEINRQNNFLGEYGIYGSFSGSKLIRGHCERLEGYGPLYSRRFTPPGGTTLHLEALEGTSREVFREQIAAGVEIEARDDLGATALHWAAFYCNKVAVEVLVEAGAEISATTQNGATPLHWAAYRCDPSTVRYLIDEGASVSAEDALGDTPLHAVAHRYGSGGGASTKETISTLVGLLVSAGADLGKSNFQGKTPFDVAVELDHLPGSPARDRELLVLFGSEK